MKIMFRRVYALGIVLTILISALFIIQYLHMNNRVIENKEFNIQKSRELLGQTINYQLGLHSQVIESTGNLIMTNQWSDQEISVNLKEILKTNLIFNLLYYGDVNNKLINAVDWEAPETYDLRTRPWYTKAVEEKTLTYSQTYVDALTGGLIITISKPIYDANNQLMGVIGGDILINETVKIVEDSSSQINDVGYSFLIDGQGNILAHPAYMYEGYTDLKNIAKVSETLLGEMKASGDGQTRITLDGVDGYLAYQPIDNTDWIIASFASLREYSKKDQYVLRLLIIGLTIALLTFGGFFILQDRYFIKPLKLLVKDIQELAVEQDISYRIGLDDKDPFIEPRRSVNMILEKTETFFRKQEKHQKELYQLSYYDHLTGIYNRRFFEDKIKELDRQENLPLGIIMVDVNGLKLVNDSFGSKVGDELLRETAQVLDKGCNGECLIFRMGGDEFVLTLTHAKPQDVEALINKIRRLAQEVSLENIELSLSFGAALKSNESEAIADILKIAEDNMNSNKLVEGPSMRSKTIDTIVQTLYEKNPKEEAHSTRVSSICQEIGMKLGMTTEQIKQLETVGLLHDIGKIAISNHILEKQGALTKKEWEEIKRHPEIGYRILRTTSEMAQIAEYALSHHERYDGKGYPRGLKGETIPLVSRIIAIADAYDAMISDRAYRKGMSQELAVEEIIRNAGQQFDPALAQLFVEKVIHKEWKCD